MGELVRTCWRREKPERLSGGDASVESRASRIGRLEKKVFLEGPFPVRYINRPRDGDFSEIEASAMD